MPDPISPAPMPKTPFLLGTGGLVPFVVLSGATWAAPEAYTPTLLFWLSSYAALIASFLGAVHWGAALLHPAMSEQDRSVFMTWSIVPAMAGWVSLAHADQDRAADADRHLCDPVRGRPPAREPLPAFRTGICACAAA